MAEHKAYSWLKHAVRRWKELYYEILKTDGEIGWVNPLSEIFRQESLKSKAIDAPPPPASEPESTKDSPASSSERTTVSKPTEKPKCRQGRFSLKIKEIQAFLIRPSSLFKLGDYRLSC